MQTYRQILRLAADLGITQVRVVANNVRSEADEAFIRENIPAEALLGVVHYSEAVADADRAGRSPYDYSDETVAEIRRIKDRIGTK